MPSDFSYGRFKNIYDFVIYLDFSFCSGSSDDLSAFYIIGGSEILSVASLKTLGPGKVTLYSDPSVGNTCMVDPV